MTDLDAQLELVHFRDTDHLNINIRVELAAVERIADKVGHLLLQQIDILKRSVEVAEDGDLLPHSLASGDVLNPQTVQDDVGNLHRFSVGDALEDGVKQGNVFDSQLFRDDVDAIADIVWVLNE